MITLMIKAENNISTSALEQAEAIWRAGGIIAIPTETVYGLGADAMNAAAVASVFAVKGRPADNPLIVHLHSEEQLERLAYTNDISSKLLARFAPGPLTLVLKKKPVIPDIVSAGLDTVGFRFPSHPIARRLLQYTDIPIAAPSANLSGRPSPTEAIHVEQDMQGRIPMIIDGGACEYGLESTVLDISGAKPVLLRPGAITLEQLQAEIGEVQLAGAADAVRPASPGMKYRHYAPQAEIMIADNTEQMQRFYNEYKSFGCVLALSRQASELLSDIPACDKLILGEEGDAESFSHNLFSSFRYADERNTRYLIVQSLSEQGMGMAYMNRLHKAASK